MHLLEQFDQGPRFGRRKTRRDALLVRSHQSGEARQRLLARWCQGKRMGAAVGRRAMAHQQATRLQAIEDRHQGRAVDAERACQRHLAQPRIAVDQHQQAEFARRQRLAGFRKGRGEVTEHRRLGATEHVAQQRRQQAPIQGRGWFGGWTAHDGSGKRRLFVDQTNSLVSPMSFKVRIAQADRTIDVPTGATILATALDAGISYPFGCQSGNCGACKSHLVKGEVMMEGYSEFALSDEEKARGLILACRAVPWEDSEVAWLEEDDLVVHPRRLLDCKVVGLDDATHDIKRIRLAIASGGPFDFSAGQFASVTFEGCPPRDYSMANVPGDPVLEFHVRQTSGGATSMHVATKLKVGDPVRVEGPFGPSYLREGHRGPIIAIAGGSGMAPITSLVERALQKALPNHISFYFGVRTERDLYLHDHFAALAKKHDNLHFIPVLSEGDGANVRHGLVHEAVAADFDEFDGCKAYLAGPPVMVEAATKLFEQRGMRRVDIHADAFYTAAEMANAGKKTGAEL